MSQSKLSEFVGTPLYQSPEQINGLNYNEKVDIFALGLILYELCASFKTVMERRECLEKLRKENKFKENFSKNFEKEYLLILMMTKLKANERPSTKEILECETFLSLKKEFE